MGEQPDPKNAGQTVPAEQKLSKNNQDRRHLSELYVAFAAFLLSLTIAAISLINAVRGAAVSALPPDRVLVYRNGQEAASLMAVAIRIPLINTSNNYNDVLLSAHITLGEPNHRFELTGLVAPVLLDNADTEGFCRRRDLNCVFLGRGMAIPDLSDDAIIIPAGGAHARYYAFELLCPVNGPACARYRGMESTLAALGDGALELAIDLRFYADGRRTIRCRIGPLNRPWIQDVGWQSMTCDEPIISGNPIF